MVGEVLEMETRVPITPVARQRQSRVHQHSSPIERDLNGEAIEPDSLPREDFTFTIRTRRGSRSSSPVSPRAVDSHAHARAHADVLARFSPMHLPLAGRRSVGVIGGPDTPTSRTTSRREGALNLRSPCTDGAKSGCTCGNCNPYAETMDDEYTDDFSADGSTATPSLDCFPMGEGEPTPPLPSPLPPSSTSSPPLPDSFYDWTWPRPQSVVQCHCEQCRRQRGDLTAGSNVVEWLAHQARWGIQDFVAAGQESPKLGWYGHVAPSPYSSGYEGDREDVQWSGLAAVLLED